MGVSWGKRGAQQQSGPTGTRALGAAPCSLVSLSPATHILGMQGLPMVLLQDPVPPAPMAEQAAKQRAGNNSPWKARTTQHLQIIGFADSVGFLQDLFQFSLFQFCFLMP